MGGGGFQVKEFKAQETIQRSPMPSNLRIASNAAGPGILDELEDRFRV